MILWVSNLGWAQLGHFFFTCCQLGSLMRLQSVWQFDILAGGCLSELALHVLELVLVNWAMRLQQVSRGFFNMEAGSKQEKRGKSQHARAFQVSVCITFANVSKQVKTSQTAMPKSQCGRGYMRA